MGWKISWKKIIQLEKHTHQLIDFFLLQHSRSTVTEEEMPSPTLSLREQSNWQSKRIWCSQAICQCRTLLDYRNGACWQQHSRQRWQGWWCIGGQDVAVLLSGPSAHSAFVTEVCLLFSYLPLVVQYCALPITHAPQYGKWQMTTDKEETCFPFYSIGQC